jgi:hypothetical protein
MRKSARVLKECAKCQTGGTDLMKLRRSFLPTAISLLLLLALRPVVAQASTDDENGEYQLNLNPHAKATDELSTFGNFGYFYDPHSYSKYRFGWPGLIYRVNSWLQFPGGLDTYYEDNFGSANTLELRPFAGFKLFVPNHSKIELYNYTRYEYRDTENFETHQWTGYSRIRSRFGIEFPLTSRACAWDPKTFYSLVDVEPFYRFDKDELEPLRVRGGLGYVMNDRIRAELIYTAEFDQSNSGGSLTYNHSVLRLNISIALNKGLLGRLLNPE